MEDSTSLPNKKEIFDLWMEGDHTLVHLDATRENVIVPSHLKGNPALTLKLSHLFQGRTESNDEGINTYLKFSGDYFECVLPWDSIFAITSESGEQKIWPTSIQTSLFQLITDRIDKKEKQIESPIPELGETSNKSERKRPTLQRIK